MLSLSEIIELDDEYKENHEAAIVVESQGVYKDYNTQVVDGPNSIPSVDEVNVVHKSTYAYNLENQLKMDTDKIRATMRKYDDALLLVTYYCWINVVAHHSL